MPWNDEYSEHLTGILKKLKKKVPYQYEAFRRRVVEILVNPEHHKPLRYDMKGFRRVHILKSFVLIFKVDAVNMVVRFEDYDHHDNIYKKYR